MSRLGVGVAVGMVMSMGMVGCGGETVAPPLAREVEVRIADGDAYIGGLLRLQGVAYTLDRDAGALRTTVEAPVGELLEAELDLDEERLEEGEQTTRTFDRARANFTVRTRAVNLSLSELALVTEMVGLQRPGGTVELVDDPCVLNTRLAGSSSAVDAARAPYRGGFDDLGARPARARYPSTTIGRLVMDGSLPGRSRRRCSV